MKNPYPGKLIAFEGPDGAGKTTQRNMAVAHFEPLRKTAKVKEPAADRPSGELIYSLLFGKHELKFSDMSQKERQLFYFINRMEHYRSVVFPALEDGFTVFSDRSLASIVLDCERPGDLEMLLEYEKHIFQMTSVPLMWPDLIIIYDVEVEVALERLEKKGQPPDFFEQAAKIGRTRKAYLEFAKKFPDVCRVIDAERSERRVFTKTLEVLKEVLET